MKKTRKYFETSIVNQSKMLNNKGAVACNTDNLIEGVTLDLFYDDLNQGSGKELQSKFNALYSSSALAVNNFVIIKKQPKLFSFLNQSNFETYAFERKFPTGLGGTPPNLDFTLENENELIAFESKYLEFLNKKLAKFPDSYNEHKLNYLNEFWFELIQDYQNKENHLDVAQLIKHCIGLLKYKSKVPNKKITLVYIYWTPINKNEFEVFKLHSIDLADFEEKLNKQDEIHFKSITYSEFWDLYKNVEIYNEHFERLNSRYCITI